MGEESGRFGHDEQLLVLVEHLDGGLGDLSLHRDLGAAGHAPVGAYDALAADEHVAAAHELLGLGPREVGQES